jgi:hypothetical protein
MDLFLEDKVADITGTGRAIANIMADYLVYLSTYLKRDCIKNWTRS